MKGNDRMVAMLNTLLADELTAISQYMVQSEMCANWGYERLHKAIEKEAIDEMKHAEKHIGRLLFLNGTPTVNRLNAINVGADVPTILENNWNAESGAIRAYNDAIRLAVEVGDNGTRALLESILADEESHIDWIEEQRDQLQQMGVENYLANQAAG